MLASNGEDLRALPLSLRKSNLARLLSRPVDGIFIADYSEARSATIYSAMPATWASRASSRSAAIAPMVPASASIG
jgi:hypothetical protein